MGNMFRPSCTVECWRLLRIAGIVFAIVLIIQYFQLPYGNALSSMLFASKAEIASTGNTSVGNSSSRLHIEPSSAYVNSTTSNALDSTNSISSHSMANESELAEGKDVLGKHSDNKLDNGADAFPEDELPSNDTKTEDGKEYDIQVPGIIKEVPSSGLSNTSNMLLPVVRKTNSTSPDLFSDLNSSSVTDKGASATPKSNEHPVLMKEKLKSVVPSVNFTLRCLPEVKKKIGCPKRTVMPLSEMNARMLRSMASSRAGKPRWSSGVDRELLQARSLIENSPEDVKDASLYAPLYRNISMFQRSYALMEQTLKVYVYKEGDKPVFHQPVLKGIYASEGWFMKLLKANKNYITKNMKKAHLFYLPFSSRMLEETLYVPDSHTSKNLIEYLNNYLTLISTRYRFWNRTDGADHFLVACHDWAPTETRNIMSRSIRSLCNADVTGGFKFGKDVSLPETYIKSAKNPLRQIGGESPSNRRILAFFAGNMHGYLRPLLLEYWQNKDPDMKIVGKIAKEDYVRHMKSSKYCICARGYEVNSPRVVEAIFYDCVPVMISDNYVPPFFETLNWEAFAVFVAEKDIPNLKNILLSIPEKKYKEMQRRVKMVQRHFLWHPKPVKYDIFYMTLHSIWFTRVFQVTPR